MIFETILFYLFSIVTSGSAVAVICSKNPVHAVLWLIFAFFNSAGLFVLLGAEFVAMLLVIVYVGAVAVLFLFVVMMLNIKTASLKKGFQAYLPIGLILAAILFLEIGAVIIASSDEAITKCAVTSVKAKENKQDKKVITLEENKEDIKTSKKENKKSQEVKEDSLLNSIKKADEEFEKAKNKPAKNEEKHFIKNTNTHQIGNVLYTDYILMFQISGLILLVAMIGAIVLTHRERQGVKRQDIEKQNARTIKNSLEIVKVEVGKGI